MVAENEHLNALISQMKKNIGDITTAKYQALEASLTQAKESNKSLNSQINHLVIILFS